MKHDYFNKQRQLKAENWNIYKGMIYEKNALEMEQKYQHKFLKCKYLSL
jgi:hypothetical protein